MFLLLDILMLIRLVMLVIRKALLVSVFMLELIQLFGRVKIKILSLCQLQKQNILLLEIVIHNCWVIMVCHRILWLYIVITPVLLISLRIQYNILGPSIQRLDITLLGILLKGKLLLLSISLLINKMLTFLPNPLIGVSLSLFAK